GSTAQDHPAVRFLLRLPGARVPSAYPYRPGYRRTRQPAALVLVRDYIRRLPDGAIPTPSAASLWRPPDSLTAFNGNLNFKGPITFCFRKGVPKFASKFSDVFNRKYLNWGFVRNFAILSGGSVLAQVFNVALAPAITRLYGPQNFGQLALFMAFFNVAI